MDEIDRDRLTIEQQDEILDRADVTAAVYFGKPNPYPDDPKMTAYYDEMARLWDLGDQRFDSEMYENDRAVQKLLYPPGFFD